jgi:hypothetical protein
MATSCHRFAVREDKLVCVDVKATDSAGRIFVVETQIVVHSSFAKRALFYACTAYADQLKKRAKVWGTQGDLSRMLIDEKIAGRQPVSPSLSAGGTNHRSANGRVDRDTHGRAIEVQCTPLTVVSLALWSNGSIAIVAKFIAVRVTIC